MTYGTLNDKMIQYEKINEPTTTGTTTSSTTETTTTSCTTQFSTESTTANSLSSTTTVATIKYFASEDKLCEMAIKDYKQKVGITPATVDANANDNGTISIRLLDEEETILDTYVIDQVTGQGTNQSGEEVNLPQTGYSDIYKVITGLAALMTVSGAAIIVKTKKETE